MHTGEQGRDSRWAGLQVLARGSNRLCAVDPDRPGQCLKFELPASERLPAGARQRVRRWLAGRFAFFSDNHTELRAWRLLHARLGEAAMDGRMAAVHAIESTRWGPALRCDCPLLADGTPARSLYHHLFVETSHGAPSLCAAVDRFEQWLLQHEVPLFDLNAGNFVVLPRGASLELVCVDAKSTLSGKELVPVSRWFGPLLRRKIMRRAARLRQRINSATAAAVHLAGRCEPD